MRKTSPHAHQACRSLLQKAVRRRDVHLTKQVAHRLHYSSSTQNPGDQSTLDLYYQHKL